MHFNFKVSYYKKQVLIVRTRNNKTKLNSIIEKI